MHQSRPLAVGAERKAANMHRQRMFVLLGGGVLLLVIMVVSVMTIVGRSERASTYTNSQFNYSIDAPGSWHISPSSDGSIVRTFVTSDKSSPEAVALDIECISNPSQVSAQTFWQSQQTNAPQNREAGVGNVALRGDLSAYKATGRGQTQYDVYTLARGKEVCQFVIYEATEPNHAAAEAVLKSFRWK